jgi:hypothetical protein
MNVDGIEIDYEYDVMGNRKREAERVIKNSNLVMSEKENSYIYNQNKRLLLEDNEYTYSYNNNGYLVSKREKNSLQDTKWSITGTA